jgi:hypothetical protein
MTQICVSESGLHHQIMATFMGKMWFIHWEMMMGDLQ